LMPDIAGLRQYREVRFFANWDGFLAPESVAASEAIVRGVIDYLIAIGPGLSEDVARAAIAAGVRRFNDLDEGWICTIEREDIYEQFGKVIDLCGFKYDEDWTNERDW